MIEIFDTLTHPTINNTWLNPKFSEYSNIRIILEDMEKFRIKKAFAVGLKDVGGYNQKKYIEFLKPYKNLIPVAFCENLEEIYEINELGYKGLKIHPRISKTAPDDDKIFEIIRCANKLGLFVMYCGFSAVTDKFVDKIENEKLIFLHTGGKDLKNTFKKLKDKSNILLDLSYTFNRFNELDDYISYLFVNFYNKICIGSDSPEFRLQELREKFDLFSKKIERKRAEMIAFRNIENFLERLTNANY